MLVALLVQVAPVPVPAPVPAATPGAPVVTPVPQSFSILTTRCPETARGGSDIVVCAGPDGPRLPASIDWGPPDHGIPSNPKADGIGALAASGTPCAASQWGCQVGIGPPIMPLVAGAVGLVKSALAKKPDKTGRVAIALDAPPPTGTLTR